MRPLISTASIAILTCLLHACTTGDPLATRVEASHERMSESEGGRLLAQAIEAHGGLETWFKSGDLRFRWIYRMKDRGPDAVIDTLQTIDVWSARAVHQTSKGDIRFGWDGQQAWIQPTDAAFSPPPHFWSLTPYYFIGIPFVLADPGANYELLPDAISFEEQDYQQVKVTFDPGTGATPDDYYIVLIHPETKQVMGVRYIVTDSTLYPDGPAEEKLLTYDTFADAGGVLLATEYRSFKMADGAVGEEIRDASASDIKWIEDGSTDFSAPR